MDEKQDMLAAAQLIDDYVELHENDPGGRTKMENNAIVMCLLHHVAGIIRMAAEKK